MNPTDFVWTREPTTATLVGPGHEAETVDLLVHRPTRYHFKFDVQQPQGSLWAFYNPGPEGVPRRDHAGTWEYVWSYFVGWLDRVKAEHEAPDLWATLQQQPALMVGDDVENTPFTPEELLQVTAQLNEVKETVRATLELEPGQIDRIETQLDYLIEAAGRARRIDWRNMLVGVLLSQVIQGLVPVRLIQHILFVVLRGLGAMFGGGGTPMLPGGPDQFV